MIPKTIIFNKKDVFQNQEHLHVFKNREMVQNQDLMMISLLELGNMMREESKKQRQTERKIMGNIKQWDSLSQFERREINVKIFQSRERREKKREQTIHKIICTIEQLKDKPSSIPHYEASKLY